MDSVTASRWICKSRLSNVCLSIHSLVLIHSYLLPFILSTVVPKLSLIFPSFLSLSRYLPFSPYSPPPPPPPTPFPLILFLSQSNGQASPSEREKQRFEVRMWASCCNKKLICLLAHYCGLWLPGPYKWKSNVALHYPFGIQLIAWADTECLEALYLRPPPYMHVNQAQVCISMRCMCESLMYTEKWWRYVCVPRYSVHAAEVHVSDRLFPLEKWVVAEGFIERVNIAFSGASNRLGPVEAIYHLDQVLVALRHCSLPQKEPFLHCITWNCSLPYKLLFLTSLGLNSPLLQSLDLEAVGRAFKVIVVVTLLHKICL